MKNINYYRIFIYITIMIFNRNIMAQGEGNFWYFGYNAGLDFNTNPPTPLTNGALNTAEGCAAVSDKNGNLLFYTDGSFVYDKNHNLMPNGAGLMGHPSSTQSLSLCQDRGHIIMH